MPLAAAGAAAMSVAAASVAATPVDPLITISHIPLRVVINQGRSAYALGRHLTASMISV